MSSVSTPALWHASRTEPIDTSATPDDDAPATQIAVALGIPANQDRDGLMRTTLEDWIATH